MKRKLNRLQRKDYAKEKIEKSKEEAKKMCYSNAHKVAMQSNVKISRFGEVLKAKTVLLINALKNRS